MSSKVIKSSLDLPPLPYPRLHPYLGLALGVLAVSAASLIIKAAQGAGAPSLIIAAGRLTLAALILIPISLVRHRAELLALNRRDLFWAATTGACLGLHFAAWITSLEYTTIASSVVLVSTAPLFVGLFSIVVWREQLGKPLMVGLLVAVLGGAIIGLADACAITLDGIHCTLSELIRDRAVIGDLLALGGAVAMAGYLLIGRRLRAKLALVPYITLGYSAAAITLVLAAALTRTPFFGYPPAAYLWIALLGLGPQLIGHSSFNWALRYLSATYVSVTVLGEPIGSTILAFIILRQTPAPLVLVGGALILGGILLASKR